MQDGIIERAKAGPGQGNPKLVFEGKVKKIGEI